MDWRTYLITVGVLVLAAGIPIVVLVLKLRSAKKLADDRWTEKERALRAVEAVRDNLDRLVELRKAEGLTDAEAVEKMLGGLAGWNPLDAASAGRADDRDSG